MTGVLHVPRDGELITGARPRDAGQIPFACKLPAEIVKELQARAATHEGGINAMMAELIGKALAAA